MKIYIKVIVVIFSISLLISCKKYLTNNPQDSYVITDLEYLKTGNDYQSFVVSVYTPLQWLNQLVPIGDIASDNSVTGGESASDVPDLQQVDDYTLSPLNNALTDLWIAAYEGVNRANYMFQYKAVNPSGQAVDFSGKEALYGEVSFLRAYYYFTLVKMFGDVPLFIDHRLSLADSKTLKRAPKLDVYAQIESDLNAAIKVLPSLQPEKGRITQYAAEALLGKVLLYENKFDSAALVLQKVIDGPFTLVPVFDSIFVQSGENGPESVFEIQYTNTNPNYRFQGYNRGQGNYAVQQCGIRSLKGKSGMPYAPGYSTNLPTQDLNNAYEAGDQRKAATVLDIEAYKTANPGFDISYQVAPYKNTGLYNKKYLPRLGQTSGQTELNYLNNFRTIRYSDVLLMAAEAYNRSSTPNDTKALIYLNQVRERAFGDSSHDKASTGSTLYEDILQERRLELAMEGERFFDLVRTGKAASTIPNFVVGRNEVFPIPQKEVDISGLPQNLNY